MIRNRIISAPFVSSAVTSLLESREVHPWGTNLKRIIAAAVLLSAVLGVRAQTTAAIRGAVTDATQAVLSGAKVTVKHIETGAVRETATNANGQYFVPMLAVGAYEVRVEFAGFRPVVRRGINLAVGDTAEVNVELQVGGVENEVQVSAAAPLVNTSSAELSYLVNEKEMSELPLNGRNYTDLALLQPGVVAYPHRDGGSVVAHGLGFSINGQDPRSNLYLLDGTPQNDFTNGPAGSAAGTVLGLETVREFRVETNSYSAEFGRNSGGQINVLTKSGTNGIHGSAYEFFRNDNLDSRNFFDPSRKPKFTRNQFGATLGGPVKKDRTFYFFGYEGLRERLGKTITSFVPDANARQGLLPDPANPGRLQNVGVAAAVRPFLDAMPLPNGAAGGDGLSTYTFGFPQPLEQSYVQGRLDHYFTPRQQVFARYTFDKADQRLPTDFPQFPRTFLSRNQFATAEHRWVATPYILNTIRGNFGRTQIGQNVEANLASQLSAFNPALNITGDIDVGGMPRFGPQSSGNLRVTQTLFGAEDAVSVTRGAHVIKAGALVERYRDNLFNPTFSMGIYTFASLTTLLQNRPARYIGLTPNGALDRYWRYTLFGFYVQDDYRVTQRLTLNIGLRYEFTTMPVDIYGRDSAILKLTDPAPVSGQLYQNPTYKNISPRFGFAWDIFGDGKTALRGGYGLYFNTNNQQNLIVTITNPPATPRVVIANPTFPNPPFERGVGNSIRPVEWNIKNPNIHIWNVNVQRELPFDSVLTVGYAGSRGVHLWRSGDVNLATPIRQSDGSYFFPAGTPRMNPAFSTIELKRSDGNSWYSAGLFDVRKRFSRGLTLQASYTFAKNLDTTQASTFFSDSTNGTTSAMPEYPGLNYNKGPADYNARHNLVINGTYELPFHGRLFSGWQLSGIMNARSGSPLTVFVQNNRSRSLWAPSLSPTAGVDRPNFAPGFTAETAVLGGPDQYFDPRAFILQPAGYLGNVGRGSLVGPNLRSLDLSVAKTARIKELVNVQFRAEAFNILNRPNFGPPNLIAFAGSADNEKPFSTFGKIRSTVTSSRQIQLGLRLSF